MAVSVLLVVGKPAENDYPREQTYRSVVVDLEAVAGKGTGVQLLGENVLLISLDNNLNGLSAVVSELRGLPYRYTISNEDMKWIEVPKKA